MKFNDDLKEAEEAQAAERQEKMQLLTPTRNNRSIVSTPNAPRADSRPGGSATLNQIQQNSYASAAARAPSSAPKPKTKCLSNLCKRAKDFVANRKSRGKGGSSRNVSMTLLNYVVLKLTRSNKGTLIDRGANGGVAGNDARIINKSDRSVNITGIDNHEMKNIPMGTVGGVVKSQRGEVVAIMHQCAIAGKGRTIHSCGQLEHHKNHVGNKSIKVGGKQLISTIDGHVHPIDIINGLPYTPMRPFTNEEWKKLPHVVWTSDTLWDPFCTGQRN